MTARNNILKPVKNGYQIITGGIFFITLALLPFLVSSSQAHQAKLVRAYPASSLYFLPKADETNPIKANIGDAVVFDIMLNPGSNLPYITKLDIKYDPFVFQASQVRLTINKNAFPKILDGPHYENGNINITLSTGSDTSKTIQHITKIGSLELKAISLNNGSITNISFGPDTLILSVHESDLPSENVLVSKVPAYVSVTNNMQSTNKPNRGWLDLAVYLDGIGSTDDKNDKYKNIYNNNSPRHPVRPVKVIIFDEKFKVLSELSGIISYDSPLGYFSGKVYMDSFLAEGKYFIKIQVPGYFEAITKNLQKIVPEAGNKIDAISLATGDINNDTSLDIMDYNLMTSCFNDALPAYRCPQLIMMQSDINDDLELNKSDYDLLLREVSNLSVN